MSMNNVPKSGYHLFILLFKHELFNTYKNRYFVEICRCDNTHTYFCVMILNKIRKLNGNLKYNSYQSKTNLIDNVEK